MRTVGIDPGKDGGLFLVEDGKAIAWAVTPVAKRANGFQRVKGKLKRNKTGEKVVKYKYFVDARAMIELLRSWRPDAIFLEEVHAMPQQGVTSMFNFGETFGVSRCACSAVGIEPVFVRPQEWQKVMFPLAGKEESAGDTKNIARRVVGNLWPGKDFRKSERCQDWHDGICDAGCIAEYGRRQILEGSSTRDGEK